MKLRPTAGRRMWRGLVRLLPGLVGVTVLAVVIAWMSGTFAEKTAPGNLPAARRRAGHRRVVAVTRTERASQFESVGTVQPQERSEVASRMLASINEVRVRAGDRVAAGDLLVTLDDREVQAQLREAQAMAVGIEADLAIQQREYERYQQLYQDQAVTREALDRVERRYEVARAQLQRVRAQTSRIEIQLSYTRITAQGAGVVAERLVDPGDLAVPGKPLLTVHDPHQLELQASVREKLSSFVRIGMPVSVRIDALDRTLPGKVREIVPRAEPASRSLLVKVALPSDQLEGVFVGMFGRVALPVGSEEWLTIPTGAVRHIGQVDLVDVVLPDGTLERRFVRLGRSFGVRVEVLAGLRAEERVAVEPVAEEPEA